MLFSIVVLLIVGVVVWSWAPSGRRRRIVRSVGAAAFVLACVLVVTLVFFRGPACRALGGDWDGHCRNEWGGNGNNDP
jgi:hypothetical protein